MFGRKPKPQSPPPPSIRDTLFGDIPLEAWGPPDATDAPWILFSGARLRLQAGDSAGAAQALGMVLKMPGLESRHYLQAYHHLRAISESLPDESNPKELLGVVIEVAMDDGLDLLAAYADGSSRYYNFSGAGVVMDAPDAEIKEAIDALFGASRIVVEQIGPWDGDRPGPPPNGQVRMNFLTPSGLHFGQGAFQDLMQDPMGAPVLHAATALMQLLVSRSEHARAKN